MDNIKTILNIIVNFILLVLMFSFIAVAFWLVGSFISWNWIEVGGQGFNVFVRIFAVVAFIVGVLIEFSDN